MNPKMVSSDEVLAALHWQNAGYAAVSLFAHQVDAYPDVQVFPTGVCLWFTESDVRPTSPIISIEEARANAAKQFSNWQPPVPALLIGKWVPTSTDKKADLNRVHLLGWDPTAVGGSGYWAGWPNAHEGLLRFLKTTLYPSPPGTPGKPTVEEAATKAYPRSPSLRSVFVKGVAAHRADASDLDNPYRKPPCTGFLAACRNAWNAGFVASLRREVA
jgi:hypothetical protein